MKIVKMQFTLAKYGGGGAETFVWLDRTISLTELARAHLNSTDETKPIYFLIVYANV